MKVCVISPGVVHAVPRTVAMAQYIDELHFVDVTGKHDRQTLESAGIVCHSGNGKYLGVQQLMTLLGGVMPDSIVCHYSSGDHYFTAIRYGRCPVAAIAMGNDILYEEGDRQILYFGKLLVRMALRRSCFVSAKSRALAKRIREYGVIAPIDVNYWGADLERFAAGSRSEARRKLGLNEAGPVILSPRALEPRLNIHLIVEAFRAVEDACGTAHLLIIGRSSPEYKSRVEATIKNLDLSECVEIRGDIDQDSLVDYYRAADVVVSMGSCEGFPNTLLEVMACRVPFVVGRIPQVEELLVDNINARICEIEAGDIASAVIELLGDPGKCERLTNEAYQTVSEYADIIKNGKIFSNHLEHNCARMVAAPRMRGFLFNVCYQLFRIQRRIWNM